MSSRTRRLARWVRGLGDVEDGPLAGASLGTPALYEGLFPASHRGAGPQKDYVQVLISSADFGTGCIRSANGGGVRSGEKRLRANSRTAVTKLGQVAITL